MINSKVSRTSFVFFLGLLLSVLLLSIVVVRPYLLALIMGAILAHLTRPIYLKLQGQKKHSAVASIAVTLGLVLLMMVPSLLMIGLSLQEGISIAKAFTTTFGTDDQNSMQKLIDHISVFPVIKRFIRDPHLADQQIRNAVQSLGQSSLTLILSWLSNIPALLLQSVLMALSCCFFLLDGKRFYHWAAEKIPLEKTIRDNLTLAFTETSTSVIWATFFASSAQSAMICVSFLALGVPAVFLGAGATFLLAWIPMVGSSPVWITASIFLLLQGATLKVVLMVVTGLSTGIVDNAIRAMVLKGRNQIHPLVSLVAIIGGIQLFGILGVFLGPILAALLITLLEIWPKVARNYGIIESSKHQNPAHRSTVRQKHPTIRNHNESHRVPPLDQ